MSGWIRRLAENKHVSQVNEARKRRRSECTARKRFPARVLAPFSVRPTLGPLTLTWPAIIFSADLRLWEHDSILRLGHTHYRNGFPKSAGAIAAEIVKIDQAHLVSSLNDRQIKQEA